MPPKWEDTTSYSRGERAKSEPRSWGLDLGELQLCVHRWHGLDGWFGTCRELGIEKQALAADSAESARNEFAIIALGRANRMAACLRKVTSR